MIPLLSTPRTDRPPQRACRPPTSEDGRRDPGRDPRRPEACPEVTEVSWPDAGDELREDLDEAQLGKPEQWYYCLKHHRPEQGHQEPARFLLGPFPTEEAASHALEKIEE